MTHPIDILLGTYNGEAYLAEQLDSLFQQTVQDFRVVVRDDGSSDQTIAILQQYQQRFPGRILLLPSERNVGVIENFGILLQHASAPYICFSDQDDVWLPHKIEETWKKLQNMEKEYGIETPLLVHTDLCVVDKDLRHISPSFWQYIRVDPKKRNCLGPLLAQNTVTGCTIMINRFLKQKVPFFPQEAIMHDHWLALVAAGFGKIESLNKATILYRQHDSNQVGATQYCSWHRIKNCIIHPTTLAKHFLFFQKSFYQADAYYREHASSLSPSSRATVESYRSLFQQGRLQRLTTASKQGFFKDGFFRKTLQLAFLLTSINGSFFSRKTGKKTTFRK